MPPAISTSNCPTRGAAPSPQSQEYQVSTPGLDAQGITPQFSPNKLNFLLLLYLFFFCIINFTYTVFLSFF
jgi:hypothetical protein